MRHETAAGGKRKASASGLLCLPGRFDRAVGDQRLGNEMAACPAVDVIDELR